MSDTMRLSNDNSKFSITIQEESKDKVLLFDLDNIENDPVSLSDWIQKERPFNVCDVSFSDDSTRMIITTEEGDIYSTILKDFRSFKVNPDEIKAKCERNSINKNPLYDPNDHKISYLSTKGNLFLYDEADGKTLRVNPLEEQQNTHKEIKSFLFSKDGRILAYLSNENSLSSFYLRLFYLEEYFISMADIHKKFRDLIDNITYSIEEDHVSLYYNMKGEFTLDLKVGSVENQASINDQYYFSRDINFIYFSTNEHGPFIHKMKGNRPFNFNDTKRMETWISPNPIFQHESQYMMLFIHDDVSSGFFPFSEDDSRVFVFMNPYTNENSKYRKLFMLLRFGMELTMVNEGNGTDTDFLLTNNGNGVVLLTNYGNGTEGLVEFQFSDDAEKFTLVKIEQTNGESIGKVKLATQGRVIFYTIIYGLSSGLGSNLNGAFPDGMNFAITPYGNSNNIENFLISMVG
jgi:5-hydroxyisourate hydrolase-like protein (transthyretin family)